jgi:peptidoglycan/xylan/chitin deacetylase (PgdA/CDA1 family)
MSMKHRCAPTPRSTRALVAATLVMLLVTGCQMLGVVDAPAASTDGRSPGDSASAATPTPRQTVSLPEATPLPAFSLYTVHAGDSLLSIAARFRTSPLSLSYWNRDRYPGLDPDTTTYSPDRIEVGWRLRLIPGAEVDPEDFLPLPSESPGESPGASPITIPNPPSSPVTSPTATSTASTAGGPSVLVYHGPRTSHDVALTLDMGGRLDPALKIMDWLIAHEVRATIFPTGVMGTTATGRMVLARVKAHPGLFALGNHSWSHPDFRPLDAAAIADQLVRCEAAIEPLAGRTTRPFFRPPFGGQDAAVRAAVGAAGWHFMVMWDVDTIDWRPESEGGPTTASIVSKVVTNARGGSIVLMHLGGYHTLAALPGIVDGLAGRGLHPVRLSDWYH